MPGSFVTELRRSAAGFDDFDKTPQVAQCLVQADFGAPTAGFCGRGLVVRERNDTANYSPKGIFSPEDFRQFQVCSKVHSAVPSRAA